MKCGIITKGHNVPSGKAWLMVFAGGHRWVASILSLSSITGDAVGCRVKKKALLAYDKMPVCRLVLISYSSGGLKKENTAKMGRGRGNERRCKT